MACLAVLLIIAPGEAHKARLFASVEGAEIKGYGYFSKSRRAKNCAVEFFGPGGRELGRAVTDDNGEFSFSVRVRCDHRLVLNCGEGHGAEFLIRADELPDNLEPYSGPAAPNPAPKAGTEGSTDEKNSSGAVDAPKELSRVVASAVAAELAPLKKQIAALREQLAGYEDKVRWHDVLGGIGFIFGLAGVGLFFMARKRERKG